MVVHLNIAVLLCACVVGVLSFVLCYFVLVFLFFLNCDYLVWGRERANLIVFRTFVRFALVWFCPFPLPLGVLEGLRLVIVAFLFLGLFSYLYFICGVAFVWVLFVLHIFFFLVPRKGCTSWLWYFMDISIYIYG